MFLGGLFFEWIQTVLILAGYVSGNATFPKPLNKIEEKKYLDLYAKGDESAKNVLIEHNLRLVAHIAKKYADEKNLEEPYIYRYNRSYQRNKHIQSPKKFTSVYIYFTLY